MIFKQRDTADARLQQLEEEFESATDGGLKRRIGRNIAIARAGDDGEREAAYHIDFHLRRSQNWAIIHDLRLEWNGRVAQIDHLLLNRLLEIYVIESKGFRTKVRFANGGWERLNRNQWEGIPSPVEQNERHIIVLKDLLAERKLAPSRLGLTPRFWNVVVVHPSCSIVGSIPGPAKVYRMDALVNEILEQIASPLQLFRAISRESLHAFAAALAGYHTPAAPVSVQHTKTRSRVAGPTAKKVRRCEKCQGPMSSAEASYSRNRPRVFAGLSLCLTCQDDYRKA